MKRRLPLHPWVCLQQSSWCHRPQAQPVFAPPQLVGGLQRQMAAPAPPPSRPWQHPRLLLLLWLPCHQIRHRHPAGGGRRLPLQPSSRLAIATTFPAPGNAGRWLLHETLWSLRSLSWSVPGRRRTPSCCLPPSGDAICGSGMPQPQLLPALWEGMSQQLCPSTSMAALQRRPLLSSLGPVASPHGVLWRLAPSRNTEPPLPHLEGFTH